MFSPFGETLRVCLHGGFKLKLFAAHQVTCSVEATPRVYTHSAWFHLSIQIECAQCQLAVCYGHGILGGYPRLLCFGAEQCASWEFSIMNFGKPGRFKFFFKFHACTVTTLYFPFGQASAIFALLLAGMDPTMVWVAMLATANTQRLPEFGFGLHPSHHQTDRRSLTSIFGGGGSSQPNGAAHGGGGANSTPARGFQFVGAMPSCPSKLHPCKQMTWWRQRERQYCRMEREKDRKLSQENVAWPRRAWRLPGKASP